MVCTQVMDNFVTLNLGRALTVNPAIAAFRQWVVVSIVIGLIHRPAK